MNLLTFTIDQEAAPLRIDRYLAEQCPEFSRSYLQKLLKEQKVTADDKPVKANYKIQPGVQIQVEVPDMEVPDILPENIPLDILYEDDYLLVVNKPKGMVVHPAAGHTEGTLVNAVMAHCGEDVYKRQALIPVNLIIHTALNITWKETSCSTQALPSQVLRP